MTEFLQHVKSVVFDWAGTMVDHGSLAPMGVFVEAFRRFGVEITIDEARGPMGMAKRAAHRDTAGAAADRGGCGVTSMGRSADRGRHRRGLRGVRADECRGRGRATPTWCPARPQRSAELRALGLKIGSTTGYTREIIARVLPSRPRRATAPTASSAPATPPTDGRRRSCSTRPCSNSAVWPAWSCIKVDDTEVGIAEGLNAGCWTVGVAATGNLLGLSLADKEALPAAELVVRRQRAATLLMDAGAHYVIDEVGDLLPLLDTIERRLARGERPVAHMENVPDRQGFLSLGSTASAT